MHIQFDMAVDTFIAFMSEQVAKVPKDFPKWLGFGGLAAIKFNTRPLKEKVAPYLEMFGVLHDGMIDIGMLEKVLYSAFENVPKLTYLNFTFDVSDADGLIAKMQEVASSDAKRTQETAESEEVEV
jgi:hypothetical protein